MCVVIYIYLTMATHVGIARDVAGTYVCMFNCTLLFLQYYCCSKVVSTDHNKPIIVPAGQDTFASIGMLTLHA
jgi:hypothetical protein